MAPAMEALALQYGTSANLAARIALHAECSVNPYGWQRWVFDRLALQPHTRVLEIACGTGRLWVENGDRIPRGLHPLLTDLSPAMLETTRNAAVGGRFVACALPDLPFDDGAFDVVIANHMLYHVADRTRGLREIRRVLAADGILFASTNGREHLQELKALMGDFGIDGSDVSSSFTLENGEDQLREVFANVTREDYDDALRVHDPALILGYLASMNARAAEIVAARGGEMRAVIAERIARDGAFTIRKSTGAFRARP
jgi:SAM-dependent methyltransferase